jgi:hypothetical protein
MKGYKAVLFALDGNWATDYGITSGRQRLISLAPNLPQDLVGKSIKTVSRWLESLPENELLILLEE